MSISVNVAVFMCFWSTKVFGTAKYVLPGFDHRESVCLDDTIITDFGLFVGSVDNKKSIHHNNNYPLSIKD